MARWLDLVQLADHESSFRASSEGVGRDARGAWQVHQDDCGSLETGKFADYAVASANPWTTSAPEWPEITFSETRIGGQVAWQES